MSDDATQTHRRQTAPRISEETQVLVKIGSLISCAGAVILATIFVYQIKTDSAQSLTEQRAFREELKPFIDQHRRLWWDYEQRTAGRGSPGQTGP